MAEESKDTATSKGSPKKGAKKKATSRKRASAKMGTAKKAKGNGKKTNMTAFILQFPESVKPQEIADKAKAQGLKLEPAYASTVRSKAKSARTWPKKGGGAQAKSPVSQHLDHVRALRGVILHVGIDRAKEMMDQIVKDLMVLG